MSRRPTYRPGPCLQVVTDILLSCLLVPPMLVKPLTVFSVFQFYRLTKATIMRICNLCYQPMILWSSLVSQPFFFSWFTHSARAARATSVRARAHTHTHTHTLTLWNTHTRISTHARTRHAHTRARTHTYTYRLDKKKKKKSTREEENRTRKIKNRNETVKRNKRERETRRKLSGLWDAAVW